MRFYACSRFVQRFIVPRAHGRRRLYKAIRETPLLNMCPLLSLDVLLLPASVRLRESPAPARLVPSRSVLAYVLLLLLRTGGHVPLFRLPPPTTRAHPPSAMCVVPLALTARRASAW